MLFRACALLTALTLYATVQNAPRPAIIGRWDLSFQRPTGGTSSGWLEVRHSGTRTLVGSFVGLSGSARPVSEVQVTGSDVRFTIPPQWERADGNVAVTARLENDRLTGSMAIGTAAPLPFTGVRAPALRRAAAPQWAAPEPLFNGRDLGGWHVTGTNEWEAADGTL